MSRIRPRSVYDVLALLSFFLVLGGGTALASYVVSSNSQIGPGTISGHKPPSGDHANIIANSINGTDIADRSGVDTCQTPLLKKFGPICAGSDGGARLWDDALAYCSGFGLRLPSVSEAETLAKNYTVPGVPTGESFWTDDQYRFQGTGGTPHDDAEFVTTDGSRGAASIAATERTVCVTDPSA
jgi:hypothetical protein